MKLQELIQFTTALCNLGYVKEETQPEGRYWKEPAKVSSKLTANVDKKACQSGWRPLITPLRFKLINLIAQLSCLFESHMNIFNFIFAFKTLHFPSPS